MDGQMNVVEHWNIAVQELSERDKILKNIISNYQGERLKLKSDGFLTLARAIVGQQISVKAADTIWKRCLLYTSPSPRDKRQSRMPSSA